jgi:hypothetical protein
MGTTLAAVLLGACSQAADMPTGVVLPDAVASASPNMNSKKQTITRQETRDHITCDGITTLVLTLTISETFVDGAIVRSQTRGTAFNPEMPDARYNFTQISGDNYFKLPVDPKVGQIAIAKLSETWRVSGRGVHESLTRSEAYKLRYDPDSPEALVDGWVIVDMKYDDVSKCGKQ